MGILTNEWDDIPSPGLVFCQASSQKVLQTEPVPDKIKEALLHNKVKFVVIHVGDTILDAESESGIDENWCLIENQ